MHLKRFKQVKQKLDGNACGNRAKDCIFEF